MLNKSKNKHFGNPKDTIQGFVTQLRRPSSGNSKHGILNLFMAYLKSDSDFSRVSPNFV